MRRISHSRTEWALLALIAVVCAVLSVLQYRWAGELSRAEPALLRAGVNDQLRRLSQSFNTDLREACNSLAPSASDLTGTARNEAVRERYAQWVSSHDRKFFLRIAIVLATDKGPDLYALGPAGNMEAIAWPDEWGNLRRAMQGRLQGTGRPPNVNADSSLIELPIFAASGSEAGWIIFELNDSYVRSNVLRRLVAEYLNPVEQTYEVSVRAAGSDGDVIFSTRSDGKSVDKNADATGEMFPMDLGAGRGGRHGRGREQGRGTRWMIAVRHRAGSLDAAVAATRRKNLTLSLLLVALLGGAACALVQFTARSRRLSEMQFQFAAGISHDLRTPLTAIRGAAFNLLEGIVKDPAAVTRYLRLILRNAEDLTSMIENVLAFSATLHADKPGPMERVAVSDVLRHAVEAMAPEVEQAGCRMEVNIDGDLPAVGADPVAVELMFRNLIGNAARHGWGGKWIGVSAVSVGKDVEVRVSDNGPGVADAERERIFEPFYRGERTRTERTPGTGLGLSLVKDTVERYKGTVQVNNSPAGGAQFTVRLPAIEQLI